MLGAIIGDIIGSVYEFNNIKNCDFPLWNVKCRPTDDSIMTIAVADGIIKAWKQDRAVIKQSIIKSMVELGRRYPNVGYGGKFIYWLQSDKPEPYGSWGNGSAMRVSSVGWLYDNINAVEEIAEITATVSHNHYEGIIGAKAIASAIFFARAKCDKEDIKNYIEWRYRYDLSTPIETIRPDYKFDSSCQGSVPQAIRAFIESHDYESAVRIAVSLGGDSDTIACMAGAIAEAYYGIPEDIKRKVFAYIDPFLTQKIKEFQAFYQELSRIPPLQRLPYLLA